MSDPIAVTSGVPQGSVLGPILFLIYVNCITVSLECHWKAFADDFKLYLSFPRDSCISVFQGMVQLQRGLDMVCSVAKFWNLCLSVSKCVAMRFSAQKSDGIPPFYNIAGKFLEFVSVHRDLGVLVDSILKFHEQIREVVRKAVGFAGELLRSTVCRSPVFMVSLFVSHIRPVIDFCSSIWNEGYLGNVRLLESVQRRWTREIYEIRQLTYVERLKNLNLYSVYRRLVRPDLIKCWKIFHSEKDIGMLNIFSLVVDRRPREHSLKIVLPTCDRELKIFSCSGHAEVECSAGACSPAGFAGNI